VTEPAVSAVEAAEARLSQVIAETWPILLDFDGPITHLFIDGRNKRLADQLHGVLAEAGVTLPDEVTETVDPLAVLRWTGANTEPGIAEAVDTACVSGEYQCVDESIPTPGAAELLNACHQLGRPVLIVSNNADGPIRRFLKLHQLDHLVQAIIGRVPGHPELMKPHPDSIHRALTQLDATAAECGFVGDSVSDITVSHTTGVRSIGYAKNTRRGDELAAAGADALVLSIAQLADSIAQRPAIRPVY